MTSDDFEPPIWVPLDDSDRSGEVENQPGSLELQIGLPTSVLAGGASVVLLAATVVFGIIAARGPSTTPDSSTPVAARNPAVAASATVQPSPTAAAMPRVSCRYSRTQDGSASRRVELPKATGVVKSGRVHVEVGTNRGKVMLSLDRATTPCAVNSFLQLAAHRFFNDTPCHRLTTGDLYVLQCGDPGGTGTGGPGYTFADEGLPSARTEPVTYPAGTVAMANAGPNTNGSQFFIVYQDTQLMPTWTVFGRVTGGLDVVLGIVAAGSTPAGDGNPTSPVIIESVSPQS